MTVTRTRPASAGSTDPSIQTIESETGIVSDKSTTSAIDKDGGVQYVSVGFVDRSASPPAKVASANIDISAATLTIYKSTADGAFSSAGITPQPTLAKAVGLVESQDGSGNKGFAITTGQWAVGDTALIVLTGVKVTDSTGTVVPISDLSWTFQIQDSLTIDTNVSAIKTKTDNLPANTSTVLGSPAGASVSADIAAVKVDTAAIKAVTGTTGDASVYVAGTATVPAMLKALLTALIAKQSAATTAGTTTTLVDSGDLNATGFWNGASVFFISGSNAGEARLVTGFASGGIFTFGGSKGALPNATAQNDKYIIVDTVGADMLAATIDSAATALLSDSVGNRGDTAAYVKGAASLLAYIKGLMDGVPMVFGTVTTQTSTSAFTASALTQPTAFYAGWSLVFLSGTAANIGFVTGVNVFTSGGVFSISPPAPASPAVNDTFLLIGDAGPAMARTISADNSSAGISTFTLGNKGDMPAPSGQVATAATMSSNGTGGLQGGLAGWFKGFWNAVWKNIGTISFNNAAISNANENDFFTGRTITDAVTNATTTVTSASQGAFTTADIGRNITGTNIPAGTTITAVVSATSITISAAATGSGTNSATIGNNIGVLGGNGHYRFDAFFGSIGSLGGAANVVIRLYADLNGVSTVVASATLTSTGTFGLSDLKTTATGGASSIGYTFGSRFLRITYQFAATPTNASLTSTCEISKATA